MLAEGTLFGLLVWRSVLSAKLFSGQDPDRSMQLRKSGSRVSSTYPKRPFALLFVSVTALWPIGELAWPRNGSVLW